jgi:two-component system sensor kinase FixL
MSAEDVSELAILRGAVENTNEAFVTIDQNHTILFFNKAAEAIFGYGRNEVIGQDLDTILGPRCLKNHRRAVARYVKTRDPKLIGHESAFAATRKNGDTFPALISFSVAEIQGRLYFTGIIRDMTETRALEDQVTRSERLAAVGGVVAEISHEINNPLVTIGGFAQQLIRTTEAKDARSKLEIIAHEVKRLESLLGELRDLYAPTKLTIERIDIAGLLDEIYSLTRDDCQARKIQARLDVEKGTMCVEGDRERLKQVLLNLAKNGIEAMEKGGNLTIHAAVVGETVEISILDDGPGIPDRIKEDIFTPFFTTKKQGTGLGLCVSKRITDDHPGCSFSVTSQEGKGTIAKIVLHRCDPSGEQVEANLISAQAPRSMPQQVSETMRSRRFEVSGVELC